MIEVGGSMDIEAETLGVAAYKYDFGSRIKESSQVFEPIVDLTIFEEGSNMEQARQVAQSVAANHQLSSIGESALTPAVEETF